MAGLQDTAADIFAFRRAGELGAPLFDQGQGAIRVLLFIKRQILIKLISVPHTQYNHRELAAAAPSGRYSAPVGKAGRYSASLPILKVPNLTASR